MISENPSEQDVQKANPSDKTSMDEPITHSGRMLVDATACPQDITYPTDLKLLNEGREKCEQIIDKLFLPSLHGPEKPRTYRQKARKEYLTTRNKTCRQATGAPVGEEPGGV